MDENVPKENPPADFNKIDLSQLQGFSFGTQWTQDKGASGGDKRDRGENRQRRDGGDSPADRRDRRAFRRPDTPSTDNPPGDPRGPGAGEGGGPPRRDYGADRRPRPEGRDYRGGPRGPGGDRERAGHGGYGQGRSGPGHDPRAPYDSPYFTVTFYPEDTSFNALVKTVRASCRTIELFEIARTVLGKPERFTVLLTRRDPNAPRPGVPGRQNQPAPEAPAAEGAAPSPAKEPIFISVPDNLPFESEEAAVAHVLSRHLGQFFDSAEVEVEPPKGNFQVINRCSVTGELLGPPNYHRYSQIVQQHYAAKAIRMPFEAYKTRIETVRDPEAVAKWLEKMKKITRYSSKLPVAEGQPAPTFDTWDDARVYLLASAKDKIVRAAGHARFHGRAVETLPPGEIRRAVEGTLERQRRFPLDTANALRGRLRREHFTIFKKGAKGISYVCAVKRKFRTPGQTFAETIGALIQFIENHPMVKAGELPKRFLGLAPEAPAPEAPAPAEGEAPPPAHVLSVEQREKIARLQGDLLWLVREGYVTEFIDGSLYAPPPMVEARRKEVEHEENDPENFPDRPAAAETAPAADAPEAPGAAESPQTAEPSGTSEGEGGAAPAAAEPSAPGEAPPEAPAAEPPAAEAAPASHHRSAEDAPVAPQSETLSEHSSAS
ncbi:MAG TPA: hypothetical protein VFE31_10215 [Opitutaceae bacterium]|jgi:hypothetical protein|nr:hypothetical protein [Opitutaceae bacterium]